MCIRDSTHTHARAHTRTHTHGTGAETRPADPAAAAAPIIRQTRSFIFALLKKTQVGKKWVAPDGWRRTVSMERNATSQYYADAHNNRKTVVDEITGKLVNLMPPDVRCYG